MIVVFYMSEVFMAEYYLGILLIVIKIINASIIYFNFMQIYFCIYDLLHHVCTN